MKLHSELNLTLIEEEKHQQLMLKIRRQQKAVAEFSKQKFIKKHRLPELNKQAQMNSKDIKKEKQKVENLKVNLLKVLKEKRVDFDDQAMNIKSMPLSIFDEYTYEPLFVNNLIGDIEDRENKLKLDSRCLIKHNELYTFVHGNVFGYNAIKNQFLFKYNNGEKEIKIGVPRILVCFDDENPFRYCDRVSKAFKARIHAQSQYRKKQMVKQIPSTYVGQFSQTQKAKIQQSANRQGKFDQKNIDNIFQEVNEDFKLSMKSIMLRKCILEQSQDIIPHGLMIQTQQKIEVPYYGLPQKNPNNRQIIISKDNISSKPPKMFLKIFQEFCEKSLLTSKEVSLSLQTIKNECDTLKDIELFKIEMVKIFNVKQTKQPYRFQHFQADHNVYVQKVLSKIKTTWVGSIRNAVQKYFRKGSIQWFNMSQKDKEVYQLSKTKRYFKQVRLMMEDNLLFACQRSFKNYFDYINRFIPIKVQVISPRHVVNQYSDGYIIDSTLHETYQKVKSKLPLFETDLMKLFDDSGFGLTTSAHLFMNLVLNIFDKMLDQLSKVPDIEAKCMIELFKKDRGEKFLNSINRASDTPENQWIQQLYLNLKSSLEKALEPVAVYIKQFDQFIPVLKMKPDQFIKQIQKQDQQSPKDVEELREKIAQLYQKQKDLLQKMPQSIRISFFKIHLKQVNQKLAAKYNSTAKGLQLLIAKKARKMCKGIIEKYDDIKLKMKIKPKEIEKLVQLRDYMDNIPNQLKTIKQDYLQLSRIYDVLDDLRYVIPQQDIKKKYQMLLGPKQIMDDIDRRKDELASKNMELSQNLRLQQEQFKLTLESRARAVAQFGMFSKKQQFKETLQKVDDMLKSLDKLSQEAKTFNARQQLFQRNLTDYSKVQTIIKQFMYYANYWRILGQWMQNYQKWSNSLWQSVDYSLCQKFVTESIIRLTQCSTFFSSKDLTILSLNSTCLKQQFQFFNLPLLLALKRLSSNQKAWSDLSQKVQYKLFYQTFTFKKGVQLNLQVYMDYLNQLGDRVQKQTKQQQPQIHQRNKIKPSLSKILDTK